MSKVSISNLDSIRGVTELSVAEQHHVTGGFFTLFSSNRKTTNIDVTINDQILLNNSNYNVIEQVYPIQISAD
ncbi:hypothetical protein IFO70_30330 [Phormidium tenue FACHB-886]|nr:hypothetical protein [Phormidium tenue FACHB-886]